ncbi:hypothetical protein HNQ94_000583 [Salirhabdus euzebyi]|uniref:NERD domain-containing protein n=1 Tax=Salirhabdus euzebyi TaxID=394506 RepID=A0A841Q1R7_9BACI|nr:NERD domain-containing protein [Salirhabdus euzebyi]MBB6452162.1 hypothetical protein [Salirhabdus euzebyi]
MAQLIKLQDYISRYETDFYRYPGQFLRLKKENWQKLIEQWELTRLEGTIEDHSIDSKQEVKGKFSLKNWLSKKSQKDIDPFDEVHNEISERLPYNEDELKLYFLDYLYPFQLKWASSTWRETSFLEKKYETDSLLKYFLQRFPDSFLVMFYPIFKLKNASVESEIIIITPLEILCIKVLNERDGVKIIPENDRTWFMEENDIQTKMLSPLIHLKRSESIVKSILKTHDINFPVRKVVLSKNNELDIQTEPYNTKLIGKKQYEEWFHRLRKLSSPLKNTQLKAGEALLKHCQTTSVHRPEWDQVDSDSIF